MEVTLNGNKYELKENTGVSRQAIQEFPDNIRLDGQQQRKDRRLISSWVIDSWSQGLGRKYTNVATAADLASLWDVENLDTRFDGQIILSPKFMTCSIEPSAGDLKLAMDYLGQIYFAETERPWLSNATMPKFYQYNGGYKLGSYRDICPSYSQGQLGSICGLSCNGSDIYIIGIGYMGASGNLLEVIPTMGIFGTYKGLFTASQNILSFPANIINNNGTLHIYIYDRKTALGLFGLSPEGGGTPTFVNLVGGIVGTETGNMVTDGLNVWNITPEGIWNFDDTPAIEVSTLRATDRNPHMSLYRNNLIFKNKKSMITYDGNETNGVGYDLRDGLPTDKYGEVTAMTSTFHWTFAALYNGSYSHILTLDENNSWQYYARMPSPGLWVREMFLSDSPDAIDRLWCIYGNYGYPGFFLNPIVNPLSAATYVHCSTGFFKPPIYDAGLADVDGGWYRLKSIGQNINANQKIIVNYDLNGQTSFAATLGLVNTTNSVMVFGSPVGVEAWAMQPRFTFETDNTGTTPIFNKAIIEYLKDPTKREQFEFTIDLKKTSRMERRPVEAIIGSLSSELSTRTLLPFWYGHIGTRHVKIINNPFSEQVDLQYAFETERVGEVTVQVAEI